MAKIFVFSILVGTIGFYFMLACVGQLGETKANENVDVGEGAEILESAFSRKLIKL